MFIDEARIVVKAGSGGHGCVAFRREKFVPHGGPSGGDGGNGGSIYLVADSQENTLIKFRFSRTFKADRGRHGEGSTRHGKSGGDLEITVPLGTVVKDEATGEVLSDFTQAGERLLVAQGGRGGHGNAHYATALNRTPKRAQDGRAGEEHTLKLELKLLADVGLVGYPNAGKSTLISSISAARPKIADYPFTTLQPHLGVVALDIDRTFVVADIPGLIDGAHLGHGLGTQFLRHIERTRVIVHLVDVSPMSGDPVKDFKAIARELELYNPDMAAKPKIVAATKMDAADPKKARKLVQWCGQNQLDVIKISSVTGEGLDELKRVVFSKLSSAGTGRS